jgi:hypothetical protein
MAVLLKSCCSNLRRSGRESDALLSTTQRNGSGL